MFAKRDSNGQYSIEEINGTIGANDTALVANRCYAVSPFPGGSAVYFGGFDPNGYTSTNMAWVYKRDYQVNAIDDITKHENNFVIYPNPASNQRIIESENLQDYEFNIINLLGKKVAFGSINGQTAKIDIPSLPLNVYIRIIANKAVKFVKTN